MQDSDDQLMRAAGSGDRAAFSLLVGRHGRKATGIAGRIVGNRADAEDVVQEAFLRAWRKAPEWQSEAQRGAQFTTWYYRVLVNLCIDRKRKPANDPIEAADQVADAGPDGEAAMATKQIGARVGAAVAALPERQRAALVLCHYEGMTNIEAAAVLELSVGALESLLVRARRSLRDSLADLAGGPA